MQRIYKNLDNIKKVKSRFNRTLKLSEILKLYMQDLIIKQEINLIHNYQK